MSLIAPWGLELLAYCLLYACLPQDKAAAAELELRRVSDSQQRLYGSSEDSDAAERSASGAHHHLAATVCHQYVSMLSWRRPCPSVLCETACGTCMAAPAAGAEQQLPLSRAGRPPLRNKRARERGGAVAGAGRRPPRRLPERLRDQARAERGCCAGPPGAVIVALNYGPLIRCGALPALQGGSYHGLESEHLLVVVPGAQAAVCAGGYLCGSVARRRLMFGILRACRQRNYLLLAC